VHHNAGFCIFSAVSKKARYAPANGVHRLHMKLYIDSSRGLPWFALWCIAVVSAWSISAVVLITSLTPELGGRPPTHCRYFGLVSGIVVLWYCGIWYVRE